MGVPAVIWRGSNSAYCIPQNFEAQVINPSASSNQMVFGPSTGNRITVNVAIPSANRTYTIPDVGAASDFFMTAGTQTATGAKTFSGAVTMTQSSLPLTINVGSSSSSKVSFISTASNPFIFHEFETQGSPTQIWRVGMATPGAISNLFRIWDGSGNTAFSIAPTTLAATIAGVLSLTTASNQLVLSSGVNQLTLNSSTSAAARTYSFPDVGTTGTVAMLEGSQTFTGLKTFSNGVSISGGSAANNTIWFASNVLNIRGGTSGTDIYNTSGNVIFDAADTGVLTFGPSASDSITHVMRGSVNLSTEIPSFSSSVLKYYGSKFGSTSYRTDGNTTAGAVNLWANGYNDGTTNRRATANVPVALFSVRNTSAVTDSAFRFIVDPSVSHSADSAASLSDIGFATIAGQWAWGPSASDAIVHTSRGSINMGGTAIPSFSSSTFRYFGNTINAIYYGNTTGTIGMRLWAGAYFDGTNSRRTQANYAVSRILLNTEATATNNAFIVSTDNSVSHSADSTASFTNVFTIDFNGLCTIGASGRTEIHNINTAALTTSTAAGISYLRISVNGATRRIPTYNDA